MDGRMIGRWWAWGVLSGLGLLAACRPGARPAPPPPAVSPQATPVVGAPAAPSGVPSPLPVTPRAAAEEGTPRACAPTPPDALGLFYRPGAPVRTRVGQGHVLRGVVRSSADCSPIAGAQIEFWLAGPDGRYADAYRAMVFSGPDGAYRFESHFPLAYSGRPPHIHIRVTAPGYQTLVTQHNPQPGQTEGTFDLVLIPAP